MNIKKLFNVLLDISGIGLGIFLIILGIWAIKSNLYGGIIWPILVFLGVCAFLIHFFGYFGFKNIRRFFRL